MIRISNIRLPLDHADEALAERIQKKLRVTADEIRKTRLFKRSVDARDQNDIRLVYSVDVQVDDEKDVLNRRKRDQNIRKTPDMAYRHVGKAPSDLRHRPVVVGAGPCGYLCALILAEMGYRPILLERGKAVRERTVDTFGFWRERKLNPESNVQFGEGGAGTFSDGKLYSRIKDKKNRARKVLEEFVACGAREEILWESKPHIGTFRLVKIVEGLREKIEALGGEIRFQAHVADIQLTDGRLSAVVLSDGEVLETEHAVFAIGHSARDTFEMLHAQGVYMEPKPFSIGFRIEHPQSMIDSCMYGDNAGHERLGSADYSLVHHCANGRSVYSFCMCPGGTVVAAASEEGRVVTNGMSQYARSERNANSGIVVGIEPDDFPPGPLGGMELQRELESKAYELGGRTYEAPAQRVGDFLAGRASMVLGAVDPSYGPGIRLTDLRRALPDYAIEAIQEALPAFGKKISGYDQEDALLTAVETRTSSPVRIERDENFQSVSTSGLYPGGEGAGYAGGILSAAVDGIRIAEAIARSTNA